MKSAIEQEIIWCETHRGESGKGKEFEDGFIAGLKQALHFESTIRVREVESSNLSTPKEPDHIDKAIANSIKKITNAATLDT